MCFLRGYRSNAEKLIQEILDKGCQKRSINKRLRDAGTAADGRLQYDTEDVDEVDELVLSLDV